MGLLCNVPSNTDKKGYLNYDTLSENKNSGAIPKGGLF
jgi:hypothetical protein